MQEFLEGQRKVLAIGGADRVQFLQGLVTNDVTRVDGNLVYAALLSPQGKYLADFFLVPRDDQILLDVAAPLADGLLKRLSMYRLRADVTIEVTDIQVSRGTGPEPDDARPDPRHSSLGWRRYGDTATDDGSDWTALRVAACVPESGIELVPGDSYILECGFERLNGVDFRKGCYVGQEVTARMKHKTELKKGLATVQVSGGAPAGATIVAGDKAVGTLFTQSGGKGIAYLRFDRAAGLMSAEEATVTLDG